MKKFCIFGNPVAHSKSPQMQNAGFKKNIIGKNDVLTVINPTIFNEIGDYSFELD